MKVVVAKDAGYCFGVRDAVNLAYNTAKEHGEVYMLGDIVHNERVVSDLDKAGAKVVNTLDEVPKNKPILFRAHGSKKDVFQKLFLKNIEKINVSVFKNKKVIINGCSDISINEELYLSISKKIQPYVNSLMFGEACSSVPIYKKK